MADFESATYCVVCKTLVPIMNGFLVQHIPDTDPERKTCEASGMPAVINKLEHANRSKYNMIIGDMALYVRARTSCSVDKAIAAAKEVVERQQGRHFETPEQYVDIHEEAVMIAMNEDV